MELAPADGKRVVAAPGQFNMLYAFGAGEAPISVSRIHADVLAHTIRAVGRVTRGLRQLVVGDTVGLRGPFGVGWPVETMSGGDVVVVAGGLGIAPLRPVLDTVARERSRFGRVQLFYGTRDRASLLFQDDLKTWTQQNIEVNVIVDRGSPDWRGPVGFVTQPLEAATINRSATALICGPEVMMRFAAGTLLRKGLNPEHLHLSIERNMECGTGQCGHCQLGPYLVCRDGPVFGYDAVSDCLAIREL